MVSNCVQKCKTSSMLILPFGRIKVRSCGQLIKAPALIFLTNAGTVYSACLVKLHTKVTEDNPSIPQNKLSPTFQKIVAWIRVDGFLGGPFWEKIPIAVSLFDEFFRSFHIYRSYIRAMWTTAKSKVFYGI